MFIDLYGYIEKKIDININLCIEEGSDKYEHFCFFYLFIYLNHKQKWDIYSITSDDIFVLLETG